MNKSLSLTISFKQTKLFSYETDKICFDFLNKNMFYFCEKTTYLKVSLRKKHSSEMNIFWWAKISIKYDYKNYHIYINK